MSKYKKTLLAIIIFLMFLIAFGGTITSAASHTPADWKGRYRSAGMKDIKVTVAAMKSILIDPNENLKQLEKACEVAQKDGARLLFLPECMLTGHGGHRPTVEKNAEHLPEGPLSRAVLKMSEEYQLCIVVGIGERADGVVYNSPMVLDNGNLHGAHSKKKLSPDERRLFDVRFGITICYDNSFPEIAMIHKLHDVDLILAPHASRTGVWPDVLTPEFCAEKIKAEQNKHEKMYRGRAYFYNVYILSTNAVGSATEGIEGVVSNHAGTVFGVNPNGNVILRTSATDKFIDEIHTIELKASERRFNHHSTRNRNYMKVKAMLNKAFEEAGY